MNKQQSLINLTVSMFKAKVCSCLGCILNCYDQPCTNKCLIVGFPTLLYQCLQVKM